MVAIAELAALGATIVAALAEVLHARRVRRLARLAFGPGERPAPWARAAPWLRVAAVGAACWGLAVLLNVEPRSHQAEMLPDNQRRHVLLVLDVSPSMRLVDAGEDKKQSRMRRASTVMESFFSRVPVEQFFFSVIACYNGSKPVVVGTKDLEVVRNILDDLPMHYAFPVGQTDLFSGLAEAAEVAHDWLPRSALLILLTDGDTVPATGMPRLPASIADVLVVGVGDPRAGSFVDGHQSRQDAGTLRQIAARLGGTYHDANEKHLPTDLLRGLTLVPRKGVIERLTRREYALMALAIGSAILALLPPLLDRFGTRWRPGVPVSMFKRNEFVVPSTARVG